MNMEITIVKTFCDFGHNFKAILAIFIRSLAISYEKNLATLVLSERIGLKTTLVEYVFIPQHDISK